MRLRARLERAQRMLGAPSEPEVFERAYEKMSRNVLRLVDRIDEPQESLSAAETSALRGRGIEGLVSWLWYGQDEDVSP